MTSSLPPTPTCYGISASFNLLKQFRILKRCVSSHPNIYPRSLTSPEPRLVKRALLDELLRTAILPCLISGLNITHPAQAVIDPLDITWSWQEVPPGQKHRSRFRSQESH